MRWGTVPILTLAGLIMVGCARSKNESPVIKHVIVYKEKGRFAGWPANNGAWSWGDEMVVGFSRGYFKQVEQGHAIDSEKPSYVQFARSLDGGESWQLENPSFLDEENKEAEPVPCPGGLEFTNPDFAMRVRQNNNGFQPSRIYYSFDRCKTWKGPYALPMFGQKRVMSRTDYLVDGPHSLMAFLTAAKQNGREGRVFCVRTEDGGKSWAFISWIGPEPDGFSIMPSTVRLSSTKLYTTIRRKEGEQHWIESWVSDDNGQTWEYLNRPAPSTGGSVGNPPSLIRLQDDRLAVAYGYRSEPYGIRARLSSDNGQSWGKEIILRDDGGCWDLGYPRSMQREDGKIVTVYYFNDHEDSERYIAATIWDPNLVE